MKSIRIILAILFFYMTFAVHSNAQNNQQDKPLEIKSKPYASARGCQGSGTARVRATFDKSGKVTQVEMVSASSCEIFNRNVIEAARKIKFKPAIKDGEPITVTKLVEYAFRIF